MYASKLTNVYKAGIGSVIGSNDLLRESEPYEIKIIRGALEETYSDLASTVMSLKSGDMNISNLPLSSDNNQITKEKAALEAGLYAITEGHSLQSIQQQTGANLQLLSKDFEQAAKVINTLQSNSTVYTNSDTTNVIMANILSEQLKEKNITTEQFIQASEPQQNIQQKPSTRWQDFVASQRQNTLAQEHAIV